MHERITKTWEPVCLFLNCISEGGAVGPQSAAALEEKLLSQAVIVLSCASYRNQALHVFLRPALLASAIHAASSNQKRKTETHSLPF